MNEWIQHYEEWVVLVPTETVGFSIFGGFKMAHHLAGELLLRRACNSSLENELLH